MACIEGKDIPQSLLPASASRKKESEAIVILLAYSFIVQREVAMTFDLHRLVHLATRSWLQKEGLLSRWGEAAIERLDKVFPDEKHQNRARWRLLLQHATFALRLDIVARGDSQRLDLAWKYAQSLHREGRYREAEKVYEQVFQIRKKVLGEEHPHTLISMANFFNRNIERLEDGKAGYH